MSASALFTLGTRGSALALAQANEARRLLAEAQGWEIERVALQVIRTSGDVIQDRPLAEAGGKGLFTKEIDAALLVGAIDAAVHSAKDLPSLPPAGVRSPLFSPRGRARRAHFCLRRHFRGPAARGDVWRVGPVVRPDLGVLLRGNVETRLRKAEGGAVGATLLALAGLKRLGSPIAPAPCSTSIGSFRRPARARLRSPHAAAMRARFERSSRSRTTRLPRPLRPSAPSWPNSKAPAARRLRASTVSRPGGFGSEARCCAPTAPSPWHLSRRRPC